MYPNQPPQPPPHPFPPARSGWARKRILIPALLLTWFIGVAIGGAGSADSAEKPAPAPSTLRPTAASTVTETATAEAEPAPAVTETKRVKVRTTVTATVTEKAPAGGSDDSGPVFYGNCSEARAAGAAPVHKGEPGYGRHLDRDGDGVGCDI